MTPYNSLQRQMCRCVSQ